MAIISIALDTDNPQDRVVLCLIGDLYCRPPRPSQVTVRHKEQLGMAQFAFTFNFPPPGASDVANRELSVAVNGVTPPQKRLYTAPVMVSDEWVFDDGDNIAVTLVDIDGHGNRSEPSPELSMAVIDDVPPPAPGELAATKRQLP